VDTFDDSRSGASEGFEAFHEHSGRSRMQGSPFIRAGSAAIQSSFSICFRLFQTGTTEGFESSPRNVPSL
jgi:hypothetical protein